MNAERQRVVERVFLEVVELQGDAERRAALDRLCAHDPAVRAEVESLLGFHAADQGVLDRPNIALSGTLGGLAAAREEQTLPPGSRVGDYTVLRVIGSGGMGVVYQAEQDRPRRTVALKLIRSSLLTRPMLRRFEHEAEVLGRLHHPGIAQIFQAGMATVAGHLQPFLAMELVEGLPLLEYATARSLGVRERITIAARICRAVQHAHVKGVIHRDLKPGNILVQDEQPGSRPGDITPPPLSDREQPTWATTLRSTIATSGATPKILDFGVARAADRDAAMATMQTGVGQIIGTLAYMSPEQVLGDPDEVDTRSDVYALGVILYQLLTGRLPHDIARCSLAEAARIIREHEPEPMSAIDRSLRGDLDVIVAKALEKDKARRYQSAAELADDLERFLLGEPIAAKRDSALYVLRKQIRRHRGAVAAAALFVLGLIAFGVYAQFQATRNRNLATALDRELRASRVERGRLLAQVGNPNLAEQALWSEFLARPDSALAHWALWEYYATMPVVRTALGAGSPVTHIDARPQVGLCVMGNGDNQVQVWSIDLTRRVAERTFDRRIFTVVLAPDGRTAAVALQGGDVLLLDTATLKTRLQFASGMRSASALEFSPDGSLLAVGGDPEQKSALFDPATGQSVRELRAPRMFVLQFRFSPDGSRIAVLGRENRVTLCDPATGDVACTIRTGAVVMWDGAFSSDGSTLYTAESKGRARAWNAADGTLLATFQTDAQEVRSILPSSDGQSLLLGLDDRIERWSILDQKRTDLLARQQGGEFRLAPGPSEHLVLSTGLSSTLRLFDVRPRPAAAEIGRTERAWAVGMDVSTDGRQLVVGGANGVGYVWDMLTGENTRLPTGARSARAVAYAPDNAHLVIGSGDGRLRLFDAATLRQVGETEVCGCELVGVAYAPDGSEIALGAIDGSVHLIDARTLKARATFKPHAERTLAVAYSPDGQYLGSVGTNVGLRIIRRSDGATVFERPSRYPFWDVSWSPDGSLIALSLGHSKVELIDARSFEVVHTLTGHSSAVLDACFHPTDPLVVTGSADGSFRLWDTRTGETLLRLEFPGGQISNVAFASHAGAERLILSGQDGRVFSWNLAHYDHAIVGSMEYAWAKVLPSMREPPDRVGLEAFARRVLGNPTFTPRLPGGPNPDQSASR